MLGFDQSRHQYNQCKVFQILLTTSKANMLPIGLGNTRILIAYAQKSPRLLTPELANVGQSSWESCDLTAWIVYIHSNKSETVESPTPRFQDNKKHLGLRKLNPPPNIVLEHIQSGMTFWLFSYNHLLLNAIRKKMN
jgi:hypothetical protein